MLARFPSMLTYLPMAIALWLAIDLLVVLWLGGGASRRSAEDENSRAVASTLDDSEPAGHPRSRRLP
jgi:hypothetical protein